MWTELNCPLQDVINIKSTFNLFTDSLNIDMIVRWSQWFLLSDHAILFASMFSGINPLCKFPTDWLSFVQYSMGGIWIHTVGFTYGQGSGFMTGRLLAGVPGLSAYSNQWGGLPCIPFYQHPIKCDASYVFPFILFYFNITYYFFWISPFDYFLKEKRYWFLFRVLIWAYPDYSILND